jgi:hypothetical protein
MKTVFVLLVQRLKQLVSLIHHFDAFLDFILILIINQELLRQFFPFSLRLSICRFFSVFLAQTIVGDLGNYTHTKLE